MACEPAGAAGRAGAGVTDVLFLAHRVPYPPDRGDKIRSFHVLRHLARRARVHLVAFADDPRDEAAAPALAALCASMTIVPRRVGRVRATLRALASGRPASLTAFDHPALRAAAARVLAAHPDAATYVFSGQMAQYLPDAGPRVVDLVDRDSAKFAAYARGPLAWLYAREARLLGAFEAAVADRADATLFVSAAEAALLAHPRVRVVENGIDAVHFDPGATLPVARDGSLIVFTGQMDYPPNVDAARWLVMEAWPHVLAAVPDARLAIVGRAPTAAVRALASATVEVTGEVADVRPWLAAARVAVAPLRLARGVQNKVLEAMAMALPVVATPAAAEGIDHAGTIRVADDAATFAATVAALVGDPVAAAALGRAARARVLARYDWLARLAPLDALLGLAA
jgi:polysaccharide biosynthesis protein PslH